MIANRTANPKLKARWQDQRSSTHDESPATTGWTVELRGFKPAALVITQLLTARGVRPASDVESSEYSWNLRISRPNTRTPESIVGPSYSSSNKHTMPWLLQILRRSQLSTSPALPCSYLPGTSAGTVVVGSASWFRIRSKATKDIWSRPRRSPSPTKRN